ncbi:28S ribosomal protein S18a, mitochondrial [Leptopilina boulardi]|uniref:28S ribosomal protein S18a, mitochondrial n=1 Tax=Leptopilina boulardi TaxID=63433 RepID=UPI0021F59A67|nr:28S ribosomal protein S18a, mitochondrial [Leptopilina boulardi]
MSAIYRMIKLFGRNTLLQESKRNFSLSSITRIKEIVEKKEEKVLTIEGKIVLDSKDHLLLKTNENGACPICSAGLDVKHTDVLILSQFVRSDGCMLPQRITGLCKVQQVRMSKLVAMAHKAGLMPNLKPRSDLKREPWERPKWKKYNTYFDEKTIKSRYRI